MIHEWLHDLSEIIGNSLWLAPLLALFAGVLSSFTPCSLTVVPLVVGYVSGYAKNDVRKAFRYSLMFSLGMTITFAILGVIASIIGHLMHDVGAWWYITLGVLMLLMALQTFGVINIIPHSKAMSKNKRRGYLGALLTGMFGGLFSSHCAAPVLIVLLAMITTTGSIFYGAMLVLLFSIGHLRINF